jgi:nicotinate phosphoribosyltransferase
MQENNALKTDFYQLTMAAGYEANGNADKMATFDLFVRKLPQGRNYLMVAGIEDGLNYLSDFHFTSKQIDYLKQRQQFSTQPESFFERLATLHFDGDVWAMKEGTIAFGNEPIMIIQSKMIEAQIVETYLENVVGSQTMFASKASRIMDVVYPDVAVEFGTRRSQDPEAAVKCARAAYIAGFAGTSNAEAGFRYDIPVVGTMAHSFVMDFDNELEAFFAYAKAFPKNATLLVDTYDIEAGVRNAITVAKKMEEEGLHLKGIRIDSSDLAAASKMARKLLNEAGLEEVEIVLSSDLDENKIAQLKRDGANCQVWAVGTALATSSDHPNLPIVYKLAQRQTKESRIVPCIKVAEGKITLPGLKQVYRYVDKESNTFKWDKIGLANESFEGLEPLLEKVMEGGRIIVDRPSINEIRAHAEEQKKMLPAALRGLEKAAYAVVLSTKLESLQSKMVADVNERVSASIKAQKIMA